MDEEGENADFAEVFSKRVQPVALKTNMGV
jgi:hypothetical protein